MNGLLILMYHALHRDQRELAAIAEEDRPYAVPVSEFERQLRELRASGVRVLDDAALWQPQSGPAVLLSFDDGHESNHRHALPLLREQGLTALFFITSGFTDRRAGYCSAGQLRELAAAGMRIGAHGESHRFLSQLPDADLDRELAGARAQLAAASGAPVTDLSYPGGRGGARVRARAAAAGYQQCFGSAVGTNASVPGANGAWKRVAVRATTTPAEFAALIRQDRSSLRRLQLGYRIKSSVRALLGEQGYHRLYRLLRR